MTSFAAFACTCGTKLCWQAGCPPFNTLPTIPTFTLAGKVAGLAQQNLQAAIAMAANDKTGGAAGEPAQAPEGAHTAGRVMHAAGAPAELAAPLADAPPSGAASHEQAAGRTAAVGGRAKDEEPGVPKRFNFRTGIAFMLDSSGAHPKGLCTWGGYSWPFSRCHWDQLLCLL